MEEPITHAQLLADGYRPFESYRCPHCGISTTIWWQSSSALGKLLERLPDGRLQVHACAQYLSCLSAPVPALPGGPRACPR